MPSPRIVCAALLTLALAAPIAPGRAEIDPLDAALDAVEAEPGAERDVALIVAIEDYAHVPDVVGARQNARAWGQWFRRRGTRVVVEQLDRAARHQWARGGQPRGILPAVEAAAEKVKPGGTLWFVFIGHGAPMAGAEGYAAAEGALLGQDVEQTVDSIDARGIGLDRDLIPRLSKAPSAVAIIDACFSGRDATGAALVPGMQPLLPVTTRPTEVTVLTAAGPDEFTGPLPDRARPAFSYLVLGALAGWADGVLDRRRDTRVTAAEARTFVEYRLADIVTGRRQTPRVLGPDRALARAWAVMAPVVAQPVAPSEPTTPVEPAEPAEPTTPVEPTTPAEPANPVGPTGPTGAATVGAITVEHQWAGLRLKHDVTLAGMAGREVEITCGFRKAGGAALDDTDGRHARDGRVATRYRQVVESDPATLSVFHDLPYGQLHLPRGLTHVEVRCGALDGGAPIGEGPWTPFDVAP